MWGRRATRGHRPLVGLTLIEVLIALALLAAVVWLLVPRRNPALEHGRRAACASKLAELYKGAAAYLEANGGFLPPAWHVHGSAIADDLSNLTFWRFALQAHCEPGFHQVVTPAEIEASVGLMPARQQKFNLAALFWKCPTKGWTDDYFAPAVVFRHATEPPACLPELTRDVPAAARPLLADVNASYPQAHTEHLADPGHNHELRHGFAMASEARILVFLGVGHSLRVLGNLPTSRLDYRHGNAANVLFLDGHAEPIGPEPPERLEAVHNAWNYLAGKPEGN